MLRGSLERFVGGCVGKDFFVSLVEGASYSPGIVHGHAPLRLPPVSSKDD